MAFYSVPVPALKSNRKGNYAWKSFFSTLESSLSPSQAVNVPAEQRERLAQVCVHVLSSVQNKQVHLQVMTTHEYYISFINFLAF